MSPVDVIVIGAGPVGENAADRARASGLSVAIVEHELVGGECSYWACVPSKTLLRSGAARRAARRVPGVSDGGELDVAAVFRRRDAMVGEWSDAGQLPWLESIGVRLVRGHGRLDGERRVVVTGADGSETVLEARHAVVIATGSEPVTPPIPGIAEARPWSSREATSAETVPERLAIVGGGVVGCEMATAFASLGSRVALIARGGLLGGMEPFAGEAVAEGLRSLGVSVLLDREIAGVRRGDAVEIDLGDGETVVADEILVATGRRPRTDGVGLGTVGLESLDVDDTMLVRGTDWLYAVGDANGRALLTHQGKYQARAAGEVIGARAKGAAVDAVEWGVHAATADHVAVPHVVFTDPEVASVGLTAAEAGDSARVVDYELGHVQGAAILAEDYRGTARLVIDDERDVVVGATFTGQDVAELVHAATIAIVGEVPVRRLWHAVPAFPTMSEVWLRLLEADGRPGV